MKVCTKCEIVKARSKFNRGRNDCRSCQKKAYLKWKENPHNVVRTLVNGARARSRKSGIPFDLSADDLVLPERCPVLNIPIQPGEATTPNSPSIDRLNPELGYVRGNVVIVSHLANRIKTDATPPQIRAVADWLDTVIALREQANA